MQHLDANFLSCDDPVSNKEATVAAKKTLKAWAARMPPELESKVLEQANREQRSVTQVINLRLAHSFATTDDPLGELIKIKGEWK